MREIDFIFIFFYIKENNRSKLPLFFSSRKTEILKTSRKIIHLLGGGWVKPSFKGLPMSFRLPSLRERKKKKKRFFVFFLPVAAKGTRPQAAPDRHGGRRAGVRDPPAPARGCKLRVFCPSRQIRVRVLRSLFIFGACH